MTEKGTYQAPAGAAVPVKGEVVATQPAEAPHRGDRRRPRAVARPALLLRQL